ncbi:MAG: aminoacyl-tRNA hydrolase [Nitrospirae bacterium]|nr:aminoacyl-tRNA hydrolase [Candidatus Manganitrophaceae bacterium]
MKLIVGLGNPGPEYEETKHNVGFWLIDTFAKRHGLSLSEKKGEAKVGQGRWTSPSGGIDFILAKPQTYMNRSGRSVRSLLHSAGITPSEIIVVYDDLDLPCGRIRIRTQGGAGGHRGVASIIEVIGTDQFNRLRIGIGRDPGQDPADYVLSPFRPEELKLVEEAVEKGAEALPLLMEGRITEAMNKFH